ncbi:loricrin-related [Striga asiatica]|uniref:Loricrin-related n=1 Tax=Striga asiatica TaxID=4170 RepID=A0A5A7QQG9_STRAF|nr:loricrin-related [Striga asiatica]
MHSSFFCDFSKNGTNTGDTTLRLDGFGYGTREKTPFSNNQNNSGRQVAFPNGPDDGCKLVLGLGPTPTYTEEPPSSGCNAVTHVLDFSGTTHGSSNPPTNETPVVDEGSTSAKRSSGGYMTGLALAPTSSNKLPESQQSSDYSMSAISEPGSACTSSDRKNTPAKKCRFPGGCTKGARGATGLCIGHGGGQRCQKPGCGKGAESRTAFCKAHGGGRTDYCVAHGGGKRCVVPGCTKSARGRTDCCVRHGGGKRCAVGGCGKSAQGSTDFCKAHGGGKRCAWGTCDKFARGRSGLCAAHASQVRAKEDGVIGPGLFRGLVRADSAPSGFENVCSSTTGVSMVSDLTERPAKRQEMIPPQVLVPLSMKVSAFCGEASGCEKQVEMSKRLDYVVPEGRVHGGGLLSLLGGSLNNAIDGI